MIITIVPMMTIESSAGYLDGGLKFDDQGKFKLIQFTDIQDDQDVDSRVLSLINNAMAIYQPDLVVMTGDNVTTNRNQSNFKSAVDSFLAPIISRNIPYAITFGNHDSEGLLAWGRDNQYDYYVSHSSLGVDYDIDSLSGSGSGYIPIYSNDGAAVKFCLWLMDSGDYDGDNYSYVKDDQITKYNEVSNTLKAGNGGVAVPTMVFQHIPVPQIYDLLQVATASTAGAVKGQCLNWSNDYWILDPTNSTITGKIAEGPCPCTNDHRNQYNSWVAQGGMVGAFFGHDHKNTFVGTTGDNITMGYAKAATLNSYNDGDPGFRYYELSADGTYTTKSVTATTIGAEEGGSFEHDIVAGALVVPDRIYVGAADNSLAKQAFGTSIQLKGYNLSTLAAYDRDLAISVDLESSCTDVALSVTEGVNISGVSVESKGTSNIYNWSITGGSASAGSAITYTLTYNKSGVAYTQYAYSYVENIMSPAGMYVFTRNYRGSNSSGNFAGMKYVMTLTSSNYRELDVYGCTRAHTDPSLGTDANDDTITNTDYSGYYDFSANSAGEDAGFKNGNSKAYGLSYFSPTRERRSYDHVIHASAGMAPVASVYVDTASLTDSNEDGVVNFSDLGLNLNFYTHANNDNNQNLTVSGIGIKSGDSGYTTSNWNTETTGITTNWASGDVISYVKRSLKVFKLFGSAAPTTATYTIIPKLYLNYTGGDYDTTVSNYSPVVLNVNTYTKAALRTLVNSERAAMRQEANYSSTFFNSYLYAYKTATEILRKSATTQAEIDSAVSTLNTAIQNLESGAEEISDNSAAAGNVVVPSVIYVGADNYGLATQTEGTKILQQVVNYHTKSLSAVYTNFSIAVPEGATNPSVVVTSTGGTPTYTFDSGTGTGVITGGTSTAGSYIKYVFTYTLNSKTYTQVAASYVTKVPLASGWNTFIRRKNDWDTKKDSLTYVSYVAPNGVTPAGAIWMAAGASGYTSGGSNGPQTFNFSTMTSSTTLAAGSYYGITDWTKPARYNTGTWYCGQTGAESKSGNSGYAAVTNVYIDPYVITNLQQVGIKFSLYRTETPDDSGTMDTSTSTVTHSGGNTYSFGTGSNVANTTGVGYTLTLSGTAVPANGTTITYANGMHFDDDMGLTCHTRYNMNFIVTDKTELRALVNQELVAFRQIHDGYDNSDNSFTAYLTALAEAQAALANTTLNAAGNTAAKNALQSAIDNLKYVKADYQVVWDAYDTIIRVKNGVLNYRPNAINDPHYYSLNEFYPASYYMSINEIEMQIEELPQRGNEAQYLDIRYQSTVNAMAAGLLASWTSMYLLSADLNAINLYLGLNQFNTLETTQIDAIQNNMTKYPTYNKEFFPTSYYTLDTLQVWEDAVSNGLACDNLKKPDQALVDTRATALQRAYYGYNSTNDPTYPSGSPALILAGLTLKAANYAEFNATKEDALAGIATKVNVVDPTGVGTFQINYYSSSVINSINSIISGLNTSLLIPEQSTVDMANTSLLSVYETMGSNLNDADYTFANAQRNIPATYESNYAYYYTPASWSALTTARNAIKTGKKTNFQSDVDTYALNIYNARNALAYNPADYSAIDTLLGEIALLTPSNYTNWATLQLAINNVVRGYDVTKQPTVDGWATAISTAKDNLNFKLATLTNLISAINAARAINSNLYTPASYSAMTTVLVSAEALRDEAPIITRQTEVNTMTSSLNTAVGNLIYKDCDKSGLATALALYDTFGEDEFTFYAEYDYDLVWLPFQEALDAGQAIYDDTSLNITNQQEINDAAAAIVTAYNNLPALYTAVDEAIARMPVGDDALAFTTTSLATAQAAIDAVVRNKKYTQQATVNGYAAAINTAIDNLVPKTADLSGLITAINTAYPKTSNQALYTTTTWSPFISAYNAAVAARDKVPAYLYGEQTTVDGIADALSLADTNLRYKLADYSEVNALKTAFEALNQNYYTTESYGAVVTLLTVTIDWNKNITEQPAVDAYADMLDAAIKALVLKDADYSAVTTAIGAFNALAADEALYTPASWLACENAVADVVPGLKIDEQARVTGFATAINTAVEHLAYVDADLTALIAAITAAQNKVSGKETWYTSGTYTPFTTALNAAIAIRDASPAYTVDRQGEVTTATTALTTASGNLAYKLADYTALGNALQAAADLEDDRDLYSNFNIVDDAVTPAALAYANQTITIDRQSEVTALATAITDAIDDLVLKPVAVELVPASGSEITIDNTNKFIYGVPAFGAITGDTGLEELGLADVTGDGYLVYTPTANGYGTGTKVELFSNADATTPVATYYIAIFGDCNGDAGIDSSDAVCVLDAYNFVAFDYDFDSPDSVFRFAMDLDNNGSVDDMDAVRIFEAENFVIEFSQTDPYNPTYYV